MNGMDGMDKSPAADAAGGEGSEVHRSLSLQSLVAFDRGFRDDLERDLIGFDDGVDEAPGASAVEAARHLARDAFPED